MGGEVYGSRDVRIFVPLIPPFHPMTQGRIERYHESLRNITPRDKYLGKEEEILLARRKIKKETMKKRRKAYKDQLLRTGISEAVPVS
jgi:hypothetical protein